MIWKVEDLEEFDFNKDINLSKITQKLLYKKGLRTKNEIEVFLNPDYEKGIYSPFLFKDMKKLVLRIKKAIKNNEKVGIFGDHDVDGVTSSTILADGLEELGLDIQVYIPDKHSEGHGINKKAIDEFEDLGVSLMISVDCGTSNVEEVMYANKKGIDVIITDHHLPKETLPDAFAIINPHVKNCTYPFKGLCGAGVAFKVLQALYSEILPQKAETLKWMLDIVAVGTVADCMPLVSENRVLVKYGLFVLSKTKRIGFQEMIDVGNIPINPENIPTSTQIGFQIGPRINAAGRMAHAKDAFCLLREKDRQKAKILAQDLEEKNDQRKEITDKISKEVEKIVKNNFSDKKFIVVASENYPVGVVGIIAGKIAKKFGKPTGIFCKEGDIARGSFRSVEGINIVEILDKTSEYLEKYGGHEAAAGASIKTENIEKFILKASQEIEKTTKNKKLESEILADLEIELNDVNLSLAYELERFEPFGEGNEEPIFLLRNLMILEIRTIGNNAKHLKMRIKSKNSSTIDIVGFGFGEDIDEINSAKNIDIMANVGKNEWNGNVNVQLNLIDWKKSKTK